jgi:hypothetical protein
MTTRSAAPSAHPAAQDEDHSVILDCVRDFQILMLYHGVVVEIVSLMKHSPTDAAFNRAQYQAEVTFDSAFVHGSVVACCRRFFQLRQESALDVLAIHEIALFADAARSLGYDVKDWVLKSDCLSQQQIEYFFPLTDEVCTSYATPPLTLVLINEQTVATLPAKPAHYYADCHYQAVHPKVFLSEGAVFSTSFSTAIDHTTAESQSQAPTQDLQSEDCVPLLPFNDHFESRLRASAEHDLLVDIFSPSSISANDTSYVDVTSRPIQGKSTSIRTGFHCLEPPAVKKTCELDSVASQLTDMLHDSMPVSCEPPMVPAPSAEKRIFKRRQVYHVCSNCSSTQTRQWVKYESPSACNQQGKAQRLCHRCGQYWRKNSTHRPESLWNRPIHRRRRREVHGIGIAAAPVRMKCNLHVM